MADIDLTDDVRAAYGGDKGDLREAMLRLLWEDQGHRQPYEPTEGVSEAMEWLRTQKPS